MNNTDMARHCNYDNGTVEHPARHCGYDNGTVEHPARHCGCDNGTVEHPARHCGCDNGTVKYLACRNCCIHETRPKYHPESIIVQRFFYRYNIYKGACL